MTAKEKAKEIVDKVVGYCDGESGREWFETGDYYKPEIAQQNAKKVAMICVDEILNVLGGSGVYSFADATVSEYWIDVKKEIELL
jgi:hypothetical protein